MAIWADRFWERLPRHLKVHHAGREDDHPWKDKAKRQIRAPQLLCWPLPGLDEAWDRRFRSKMLYADINALVAIMTKNMTGPVGTDEPAPPAIGEGVLTLQEAMRAAGASPACLLYTSPSPRDKRQSRMPSSA